MRGFLVAVFVQAWREFLDQLEFEQGGEVGDAAGGDEGVLQRFARFCFVGRVEVFEWEGGGGDVFPDCDVDAVDFVLVGQGQPRDQGFGAEAGDLEEVGQRRLVVRVAEEVAVVGGLVPFGG